MKVYRHYISYRIHAIYLLVTKRCGQTNLAVQFAFLLTAITIMLHLINTHNS